MVFIPPKYIQNGVLLFNINIIQTTTTRNPYIVLFGFVTVAGINKTNSLIIVNKSGDDANSITRSGDYLLSNNILNIPLDEWGIMKVSGNVDCFHFWCGLDSGRVFVRSIKTGDAFKQWKEVQFK